MHSNHISFWLVMFSTAYSIFPSQFGTLKAFGIQLAASFICYFFCISILPPELKCLSQNSNAQRSALHLACRHRIPEWLAGRRLQRAYRYGFMDSWRGVWPRIYFWKTPIQLKVCFLSGRAAIEEVSWTTPPSPPRRWVEPHPLPPQGGELNHTPFPPKFCPPLKRSFKSTCPWKGHPGLL